MVDGHFNAGDDDQNGSMCVDVSFDVKLTFESPPMSKGAVGLISVSAWYLALQVRGEVIICTSG